MSEEPAPERIAIIWSPEARADVRTIERDTAMQILNCIDRYLTSRTGDQIMLTLNGTNCTVDPTHGIALEAYVVTGGTGRYVGATGYGTETVHMDNTNPAAPIIIATFKGTLSAPTSSS